MPLKNPDKCKDHLNEKELEVLERISYRSEYIDYFFKTKSDLKWFWPLSYEGYFDVDQIPGPIEAQEKGYYSTPQWIALDYLIKTSKQLPGLSEGIKSPIEDELIKIILRTTEARKVLLAHDSHSLKLDNFRVWYGFAQILRNIPKAKITVEVLGCFEIWMNSAFDTVLPGTEIGKHILPQFITLEDTPKAEIAAKSLLGYRIVEPQKGTAMFENEHKIASRLEKYWIAEIFLKRKIAFELGKYCSQKFVLGVAAELRRMFSARHARRFDFEANSGKKYAFILSMVDVGSFAGWRLAEVTPLADPEAPLFKRDDLQTVVEISEAYNCKDLTCFVQYVETCIKKHLGEGIKVDQSKVADFYARLAYEHSTVWIETLYDNYESGYEDSISVYVYVLRELLSGVSAQRPDIGAEIIRELWGDNYRFPVFKRLGLYCIGRYYERYKNYFWDFYFTKSGINLLDDHDLRPEMHELIRTNAQKLSKNELLTLESVIEAGPPLRHGEECSELQTLYWKQVWYSALNDIPEYSARYETIKAKTNVEVKVVRRVETWCGPGKSPRSKEELLATSNKDISDFLCKFTSDCRDFSSRITTEGLAEVLQQAAAEKPEKFLVDMGAFLQLPYRYAYSLLDGIYSSYKNGNRELDWGGVFNFIVEYTSQKSFWADELINSDSDIKRAKHDWVVGKVAEIIRGVTAVDDTAISIEYNPVMQEILIRALQHLTDDARKVNDDPLIHYLNSPEGKTIEALLNLSLRCARTTPATPGVAPWKSELRAEYQRLLAGNIYDAYTVLGRYLVNFYYLDEKWTSLKIKEYEKAEADAWTAFATGYLSSHHVYKPLYDLMRPHYDRAISTPDFKDSRVKESIGQHVAIGYLRDYESLGPDTLISSFLEKETPENINRLIGYLWMQRLRDDETNLADTSKDKEFKKEWVKKITPRIIELWRYIYEKYQVPGKWGETYRVVHAEVVKLAVFLDELTDESAKWLLFSSTYLNDVVDTSFLIGYLAELMKKGNQTKNAEYLGAIWMKLLDNYVPDYKLECVRAILKYIQDNNPEMAKVIIARYVAAKRIDVVKDLESNEG